MPESCGVDEFFAVDESVVVVPESCGFVVPSLFVVPPSFDEPESLSSPGVVAEVAGVAAATDESTDEKKRHQRDVPFVHHRSP